MESFKDSQDSKFTLSLTIGAARRIAKTIKVDFIDGEPQKIATELLTRPTLQLNLVWELLDGKDALGLSQDEFEENHLDGETFERARTALYAEIENFIQYVRPEVLEVFKEMTHLIQSEITKSASSAASLLQSTELKEGFSQANADAVKKAKKEISKLCTKLREDSE